MSALTRVNFLLLVTCVGTALGCCASPPNAEELLNLGYRSPTQAFHTLRAAVRGDLPRLEYRALSSSFRRRYGLSQLTYREFRETWYAENPWIKAALSRADVLEVIERSPERVTLRVGALGADAFVDLVAEDFYQLWDGDELREDALVNDLGDHLSAESDAWVARIPGSGNAPTELRLGREWKIDNIRSAEPTDP